MTIDKSEFDKFVGAVYAHVADELDALGKKYGLGVLAWPENADIGPDDITIMALLDSDLSQVITKFEFPPEE